tara:strand:+ start:2035 stop:2199 length:165 start_codon:yes stop_codon:yes gene_type:complete
MKQVTEMTTVELKGEFEYNNHILLVPDLPDPCPHRKREVEDEYSFRLNNNEDDD